MMQKRPRVHLGFYCVILSPPCQAFIICTRYLTITNNAIQFMCASLDNKMLCGLINVALPVITRHPNYNGPITVAVGSDVMLECQATGNGTLNYHWKRVSGSLPSSAKKSNGGQILTLHDIKVGNNGEYCCEVDNGGERVTSSRVQVTAKSQLLCKVTI